MSRLPIIAKVGQSSDVIPSIFLNILFASAYLITDLHRKLSYFSSCNNIKNKCNLFKLHYGNGIPNPGLPLDDNREKVTVHKCTVLQKSLYVIYCDLLVSYTLL
jgi:hypothetical protein